MSNNRYLHVYTYATEGKIVSKNSGNIDLRVQRTRKHLLESLISLICEKGFASVTVKDITERAMVNRATFYHHYEDKDDLLTRGMDSIFDEMIKATKKPISNMNEAIEAGAPDVLVTFFEHIAANSDFYIAIFDDYGVTGFTKRLEDNIKSTASERIQYLLSKSNSKPIIPEDILIGFNTAAYFGLIKWWLLNGMPYSPQEIADYYIQMNIRGLYNCIGLSLPEVRT